MQYTTFGMLQGGCIVESYNNILRYHTALIWLADCYGIELGGEVHSMSLYVGSHYNVCLVLLRSSGEVDVMRIGLILLTLSSSII